MPAEGPALRVNLRTPAAVQGGRSIDQHDYGDPDMGLTGRSFIDKEEHYE